MHRERRNHGSCRSASEGTSSGSRADASRADGSRADASRADASRADASRPGRHVLLGRQLTAVASISVVITTLDDRQTLRDCLDGVLAGNPSVMEVLVVDRGSVDGTSDMVRRAGPPVRLLERPGSHPAGATAVGAAEAVGDVVAFVPSRAVLRAGLVEEAAATGQPTTIPLRPVGATAFGRAAAAVVGSGSSGWTPATTTVAAWPPQARPPRDQERGPAGRRRTSSPTARPAWPARPSAPAPTDGRRPAPS